MKRARLFRAFIVVAALGVRPASSAGTWIDVRPGASTISPEERAIEADPSKGIEHGVVLLEETQLNDAHGLGSKEEFHLRAKILSSQGRDLANVEILLQPDESLVAWWGRTLLPDGRVLEIENEDAVEQTLVRVGQQKLRAMRFALEGVVPGSVIDYGYTMKRDALYRSSRVTLQRALPVRRFRYRWKPWRGSTSAYRVYRSDGLDVRVESDRGSVLVEGNDLPPVPDEPLMPPHHETRASIILYYMRPDERYEDYWNDQAKRIDKQTRIPVAGALIEKVLSAVGRETAADFATKLKRAYDWIASNVENPLYVRGGGGVRLETAVAAGSLDPLDRLFIDVARALGAEAHVVLAPDRTKHSWDRSLKTLDQLESSLVAVHPRGDPDATVVVDLDSGLPFAEVPWWVSGVEGLIATRGGARPILLRPSSATTNVARAVVEQAFSDDGSKLLIKWSQKFEGQGGMEKAQALGTSGMEREGLVTRMCGVDPELEVVRADGTVRYPPVTALLACEGQRDLGSPDAGSSPLKIGWAGPWVGALPDLLPGRRVHPVVFDFPHVDILESNVSSPPGFRPKGAPEVARFAVPHGKYQLAISVTPRGYKVERAFALLSAAVPASEYESLLRFLADVRRADATMLEFVREEARP